MLYFLLFRMFSFWLLVHSKGGDFDVWVEDIDLCHVMGLYEMMFEDSVKQNVFLPKYFILTVNKPTTNRRMELDDDYAMLKMWEWNQGKETIEVWLEEVEKPWTVFCSAKASWEKLDECFPGNSQPQPSQCYTQPTPPGNQHVNPPPPQPTPPPEQPNPPPPQSTPPPAQPNPPHPPKKSTREKPKEWRVPKTTALRHGTFIKGQTGGTGGGKRVRRQQAEVREVDDDDLTGDDSDDSNYVFSDLDDDDDDNVDDVDLVDEDDLVVSDEIHEKRFEDYLDGSHNLDKMYLNGKIWSNLPFGSIALEEWLIFESKTEFLQVFRDFCIQEGFAVTVERADSARYTAYCLVQSCSWRIHATGLKDNVSWAIKSITGKHNTCGRLEENPMVSSEWLCRHLLQDLEANPEIPVDALQKLCMERYRLNVTIRLLYKVRSIAREQIYGSFAESYALLPRYAEMIKATNPGSYALVTWTRDSANQDHQFTSCFFSFAASVKGFLGGCRPIIGIDGAHLSGYYKGVMLTAVAIDGNNEIFVVAFGVVASESIDSWTYFFRNLRLLFEKEGCQKDDWTFISDRMRVIFY